MLSILTPGITMGIGCAQAVHRGMPSLWVASHALHNRTSRRPFSVYSGAVFTSSFAPSDTYLYTRFQQYFYHLSSVAIILVHIFHRAYKHQSKFNKGTL
jgi:hypothetical protein